MCGQTLSVRGALWVLNGSIRQLRGCRAMSSSTSRTTPSISTQPRRPRATTSPRCSRANTDATRARCRRASSPKQRRRGSISTFRSSRGLIPTKKAHTLTRLARDKGTQHALANAIAAAYFLGHRLINEDEVLADIAISHGFDRAEALAAISDPGSLAETEALAQAAARGGIHGVPFFILQNKYALSGAQPQEVFDAALTQVIGESSGPAA